MAYLSGIPQNRIYIGHVNSPGKPIRLALLYKQAPAAEPYVMDYYYGHTTIISQHAGLKLGTIFSLKEIFTPTDPKGIHLQRVGHSVQLKEWNAVLLDFGIQFDEHREPVLIG